MTSHRNVALNSTKYADVLTMCQLLAGVQHSERTARDEPFSVVWTDNAAVTAITAVVVSSLLLCARGKL